MPELFVATDPRGYEVVCDQELWDKKVLVKHPIMKGTEKEVNYYRLKAGSLGRE